MTGAGTRVPTRVLFDTPVAAMTLGDVIDEVDAAIESRTRLVVGVVNAAKIVNMHRDDALRRAVLASDLILADGASVVAASRLLGRPLPERVAGIDLMLAILARGSARGYHVFLLGASADVLDAAHQRIRLDYPGVRVVGRHHGYFGEGDEAGLADAIRASGADVLFVATPSPLKERFLARWGATIGVPVCHGVGGSFDVLAGRVKRAPRAWQRLGLEWLYRLKQEPRRLWKRYLVTNSAFMILVVAEALRGERKPVA